MSIEKNIERIADALERIAETVAGLPVGGVGTNEVDEPPAEEKKSAGKKTTARKKTTTSKKATGPELTVDDVRDALKEYQKAVGGGRAGRELLEEFGASKLSELDEGKFAEIVEAAAIRAAAAAEADDDDDDDLDC